MGLFDDLQDIHRQTRRDIINLQEDINNVHASSVPLSDAGTAFPTVGVPKGLRFFRTDLGDSYTYDGTYWLGAEVFTPMTPTLGVVWPIGVNTNVYTFIQPFDMRITGIYANMYVSVTNNAANYWLLNFYNNQKGSAVSVGNVNTSGGLTLNTWGSFSSIPTVPGLFRDSTLYIDISVVAQKQLGAPGNLTAYCGISYRRIVY